MFLDRLQGFTVTLLYCPSGTYLTHKHTAFMWSWQLTEGYLPKLNITCSVSSVRPWKATRLEFFESGFFPCAIFHGCWVSSVSGESDGNKGLRVSGWGERFNFCCTFLFYDLEGEEWVCCGGVFFFFSSSGQLWRWGPLFPQGHNSTNECLVVGSQGPQHTKVSSETCVIQVQHVQHEPLCGSGDTFQNSEGHL